MKKAEKPFVVEDLLKRLKDAKMVVAVDYSNLGVKEITKLREAIKEAGGRLIVVKNTLFKLAFSGSDKGKKISDKLVEHLQGPTAVVFSEKDELAPLQVIGKFIKEIELPKFKFGFWGKEFIDKLSLEKLSVIPGREVLYGHLLVTLTCPTWALLETLQIKTRELLYLLERKSKS